MEPTTDTPTETPAVRLWRVAGYKTWFVSDTAKELAGALTSFAVPLIALMVTDDPAQAGVIAAVGIAVGVVLTLVGGVLADRHRRVVLMLIGSLIGVVLAGAFTVLDAAGAWTFALLLAVNVLLNAREGLFDIAGETAVKGIVPDAAMGRAQAANQGRGAVIQLAGGPLGGILLGVGGWLIGLVAMLCHAVAAVTAWMLGRGAREESRAASAPAGEAGTPRERLLPQLRSGFAWMLSRTDLRGVLWAATIINLGFSAAITTVIYALQQDGHAPVTIGWFSAVTGAAMLVGAIIAPLLLPRVPRACSSSAVSARRPPASSSCRSWTRSSGCSSCSPPRSSSCPP
ncbi:MFS transporter [Microbacterium sp. NIBRBAC000506063]|uniref:MFS transporter n=1 Tax=Microbacterium sp. NIBRBAC000506063 TaxID=2734618 RepID=UPI001CB70057|nr:MFS transporter [Microbacterium sp. NIBRBAC000506063]